MQIGLWQAVIILCVVLIIFGAGKLPRVMKDIGQGIKGFKEGLDGEKPSKKKDKE